MQQLCWNVLHVVNPHLHVHLLSFALVELGDSTGDCHMTQYYLDFLKSTFPLSNSEEQLGNLSELAVSTLFINPPGPFWLICCAKLTLYLIDDLDFFKRNHFRCMCVCVLVRFNLYYSIRQCKWHFEKKALWNCFNIPIHMHAFSKYIACQL